MHRRFSALRENAKVLRVLGPDDHLQNVLEQRRLLDELTQLYVGNKLLKSCFILDTPDRDLDKRVTDLKIGEDLVQVGVLVFQAVELE